MSRRDTEAPAHSVGIDALRGLAILLVWCHHLYAYLGVEIALFGRIGGLIGVQLFFVISGYLIVRSATRETLRVYALRRAMRIFPAYWVAVALITLASSRVSLEAVSADPASFALNAFALSHWWPPAMQKFDVTSVNWTLAVEIAWYLLAPLVVWFASRDRSRAVRTMLLLVAAAVSTGWVLAAQSGQLDASFANGISRASGAPVDEFMRFAYIVNLAPAHLVFFAFGAAVLAFEPELRSVPRPALVALVVAFVPLADRWNAWLAMSPSLASGIGLAALFVLWGPGARAPARWWLYWLARLGTISYSVYLIHVPVMLGLLAIAGEQRRGSVVIALAAAIATIALSILLYRLVERPGIALGRSLTRPRAR
ncbi:MAG: acyltransferase [Burkholderiaceae bacterium]|nr:acyltransferase [Burkholderiaceae bacterium]